METDIVRDNRDHPTLLIDMVGNIHKLLDKIYPSETDLEK